VIKVGLIYRLGYESTAHNTDDDLAVSYLENCTRIILNEPLLIVTGEESLKVIRGGLSTFAVSSIALSSI
jgi:hypothetical protein